MEQKPECGFAPYMSSFHETYNDRDYSFDFDVNGTGAQPPYSESWGERIHPKLGEIHRSDLAASYDDHRNLRCIVGPSSSKASGNVN
jgi:hypothetical protein